jgi:hypothetical protein
MKILYPALSVSLSPSLSCIRIACPVKFIVPQYKTLKNTRWRVQNVKIEHRCRVLRSEAFADNFFIPFGHIRRQYLKMGHDYFLPHPFLLFIFLSSVGAHKVLKSSSNYRYSTQENVHNYLCFCALQHYSYPHVLTYNKCNSAVPG